MIAGILVLSVISSWLSAGRFRSVNKLENGGLYWHLVDVIWIFLLLLFYLAA